ncbi:LuxR C-terminal-related transcriptional regulator [Hydrogenophaga sp.]|uniref:LuxR C-terminal-related transcriptional regulator n=1 Tax=Hydrogenophaga sp. TaxID=1904254 RepID=UPI0035612D4F
MRSTVELPDFAQAKIRPPQLRTHLVARPGLEQALLAALPRHRLTLLVAPAGYGKTAALARMLCHWPAEAALAWITADEDDHLQRLLACLTAALEPLDLPWRVAPEALGTLAQADGGLRGVANELINALASAEVAQGLIVIDDAHSISDPRVFALLQAVLDHLPEHWSVAIASRVDPPLSLARWRVSGELAEFRRTELRFNAQETAALSVSMGLGDMDAQLAELLTLTEGWAVGLRLGLSAQANARGGGSSARDVRACSGTAHRHLFDYLASEVLDDMPDDLCHFLLRCSVLPELSAERCAHVSQLPQAAYWLEEVERRGLFVTVLDSEDLTLRLHDLFRDFLESRLQRDHADQVPALLCRAAEHEPDLTRAVGYLLRAGDWDQATRRLVESGPELIARGGAPALDQMLDQFPGGELAARPDLHLLRGMAAFPRFDFDMMSTEMLQGAEGLAQAGRASEVPLAQAFATLGMMSSGQVEAAAVMLARLVLQPLPPDQQALVRYACAWCAFAQGRSDDVAPHLVAMVEGLERCADVQVGNGCFFLSMLAGFPGARPALIRFADCALRLSGDQPSQLRAGAWHLRTWLALEVGDLAAALQHLTRADEDVHWLGRPRSLMTESWMSHTLLDALRGDAAACHAAAHENARDMTEHSLAANRLTHEHAVLFAHVRGCWILGDMVALRSAAALLARTGNVYEWAYAESERQMGRAMVALADGDLALAHKLLQPLAAGAEGSVYFVTTQLRLMLADVAWRLGRHDEAAAILRPWCAQALGGGEVGGALMVGSEALQRLAAVDWGTHLGPGGTALLQQLAQRLSGAAQPLAPDGLPLESVGGAVAYPGAGHWRRCADDPTSVLTEREREVLARIAAGDSNKLIARRFDLSPHTVKRHVANILGKLDVTTRGQAAACWRGLPTDQGKGPLQR